MKELTYIYNEILNKHKLFIGLLLSSLLIHLLSLSLTKISLTDSKLDLVPETKTKIKLISVKKKKQIVETNQKENKKKLDDARDAFLSKSNSAVDKATVAKKIGKQFLQFLEVLENESISYWRRRIYWFTYS